MLNTSKVAKHHFYNLFQNLKMSPIRTVDDLVKVPQLPGSFIFWIDEAPPRCLYVGIASPKLEGGLSEKLTEIITGENKKSELRQFLARDGRLGKEFKLDLRKPENRTRFLHDHVYFQFLTIGDMKDDELQQFEEFLKESSELNPRYPQNDYSRNTGRRRK